MGVLGEGLRLDLEAVTALELQAGERLGEVVTIHNHAHSVDEVYMRVTKVSMKCV